MADRVVIADIDLGVDKLTKNAGEVKKRLEELKQLNKELKKDTDNLTNANKDQLKTFTENEVEIKNLNAEYRRNIKTIDALVNIQNEDIKTKNQARDANLKLIAIANELNVENEEEAALLKKVNEEIDKNTEFIKENASEYENTKINIGNYKESVIEAFNETSGFNILLRDGKEILAGLGPLWNATAGEIKGGTQQILQAQRGTEGLSKSQKAAAVTTNILTGATRVFTAALIATGIGAILVLLGSLVAYFKSTQEGIDKVTRVLTPLRVVFESVFGVIQKVGEAIVNAFNFETFKKVGQFVNDFIIKRFEQAGKVLGGIVKIIKGDFKEGFDQIKGVGKEISDDVRQGIESIRKLSEDARDFLDEAWQRGRRIADLSIEIEESENNLLITRAEQLRIIKEQNKIAEDITKTSAEREAAALRSIKASEELLKIEQGILDLKIEQKELENASNDTTRADQKELNELIAERIAKETEALELQTTQQNKLNQIRRDAQTKLAKARAEAIEKSKLELAIYAEQDSLRAKSISETIKLEEKASARRLEILQEELKGKANAEEKYRLAKLKEENALLELIRQQTIENAQQQLEDFIQANKSKLDNELFFSEQAFNQERERLELIAEQRREFEAQRFAEGVISQEEYNNLINQINEQNRVKQEELQTERDEAQKLKELADLENQRLIDEENFLSNFEIQAQRLELKRQQEIEAAKKSGADVNLINERYALAQERLDAKRQDAQVASYREAFGQIASIITSAFGNQKELAAALATVDTIIGAQKAYISQLIPGDPSSVGRAILAAAQAGAAGTARVVKIIKTRPPRAKHGLSMDIEGKSHAQGGETLYDESGNALVEAEGGEKLVILNKGATAYLNALSALNKSFGGVSLSTPVKYAQNGGQLIRTASQTEQILSRRTMSQADMINLIADRIADQKIAVPVDRITDIQVDTIEVEAGANHG